MWVLVPLRHRQVFSLAEANAALAEKVKNERERPYAGSPAPANRPAIVPGLRPCR
jgi:hypothetical protein